MPVKTVDIRDAEGKLTELLALVREGTEIILVDGSEPLARLTSMTSAPQPRILGLHAHLGTARMSDDFDAPLPDEFWLGEA